MSYYTGYNISFNPEPTIEEFNQILKDLTELSGYSEGTFDSRPPTPPASFISLYTSWYDYEENMIAVSKKHPNILMEVNGAGENNDDLWTAWFKNGKYYRTDAEIIYPVYDESKMI
ncbi:hypothetical protein A2Z67_02570 [Candidatus Woesebacteria bacterium RBG_13_36_22]|uniref:Uncharacterized protein n=1 Tax=Candidatus Woesebacteria bacterium RBG_13_36_22 TaxID=1802478 RepID=A0A1F7X2C3_9BACT|nr:MAG: hypothetical protein A2Z67_02570 [Candidatus Woesebacteria bacterium RBG_13_36_22]